MEAGRTQQPQAGFPPGGRPPKIPLRRYLRDYSQPENRGHTPPPEVVSCYPPQVRTHPDQLLNPPNPQLTRTCDTIPGRVVGQLL